MRHREVVAGPLVRALEFPDPTEALGVGVPAHTTHVAAALAQLDAAIGHASAVGCTTKAARSLLDSAVVIRHLRVAYVVRHLSTFLCV
jgi:hypothetical protein